MRSHIYAPSLSTLAYRRSIAVTRPFANTSLAEDLDFADAVVTYQCEKHKTIRNVPWVYTRHGSNTWNWTGNHLHDTLGWMATAAPPGFVATDLALQEELDRAASHLESLPVCNALERRRPDGFSPERISFPQNPKRCSDLWAATKSPEIAIHRTEKAVDCEGVLHQPRTWEDECQCLVSCSARIKWLVFNEGPHGYKGFGKATTQVAREYPECAGLESNSCKQMLKGWRQSFNPV